MVLRHTSVRPFALAVLVLVLTAVGVLVDSARPRSVLTCYRHETDPSVADEDIDCVLQHHLASKSLSFELGRVSIVALPRRGGARRLHGGSHAARRTGDEDEKAVYAMPEVTVLLTDGAGGRGKQGGANEPEDDAASVAAATAAANFATVGLYTFEVRLHRKFPMDSAEIPLFRFHSRCGACCRCCGCSWWYCRSAYPRTPCMYTRRSTDLMPKRRWASYARSSRTH